MHYSLSIYVEHKLYQVPLEPTLKNQILRPLLKMSQSRIFAVISISTFIISSISPHCIIVQAGLTSPNHSLKMGIIAGKSFASGRIYRALTTSLISAPAFCRALWMFRRTCWVCSVTVGEMVCVTGS